MISDDPFSLLYLTTELADELDFEQHLDALLIPRTVGSDNHTLVQDYLVSTLQDLGFSVEQDKFDAETPIGVMPFNNIMGHSNPDSPRRIVIGMILTRMGALDNRCRC